MLRNRLNLSQQSLVLIAVPLIFELVFIAILWFLLHQAEDETRRQAHARAVLESITEIEKTYYEAGSVVIIYIHRQKPSIGKHFEELLAKLSMEGENLKHLVGDETKLAATVKKASELNKQALEILSEIKNNFDISARPFAFFNQIELHQKLMYVLQSSLRALHELETETKMSPAMNPATQEQLRSMIMLVLAFGVIFNIALAIALAQHFQRTTATSLRVIMDNIDRFGQGRPLKHELDGVDEIAVIDRTFHRMASSLAELEQQRKDFAAMVSHDLRTPLSSFLVFVSLLANDKLGQVPPAVKREAIDSENELKRLISLINNLLDLQKSDFGDLALNLEPTLLSEIVQNSTKVVNNLAQEHSISIKNSITEAKIDVDKLRLTQVIVNLLSNALKFTSDGGTITISSIVNGEAVEIDIGDEGPGIPDQEKERIFDRYYTTPSNHAGTGVGLGLMICKRIIEEHGGSIGVRNNQKKGSTFWFRLPIRQTNAAEPAICDRVT
jgi:signal transduction histidine kinase